MNDYAIIGLVTNVLIGLVVLVPVLGLTARFVLRPFFDAHGRNREYSELRRENEFLEKRVAFLEHQHENLEREMARIREAQEFNLRLGSGADTL